MSYGSAGTREYRKPVNSLTVEQLWSMPLKHATPGLDPTAPVPTEFRDKYVSVSPIRIVMDPYHLPCNDIAPLLERLTKTAWKLYEVDYNFKHPILHSNFDKFRFRLRKLLFRWKVII